MNFKKITAIATSALMTAFTIGAASAASYPAPFIDGGTANVAVVYGANAAATDAAQAGNIQTSLASYVSGSTSISVDGGEVFKLDKDSTHFNFNDALNSVYTSLDVDELPNFLADGTYDDGSIDEDYTQEITLSSKKLTLFADTDYDDDTPTVGFHWDNNDEVLSYTLELDNAINMSDMVDTDFPLLGGKYYVLSANLASKKLEILDSADTTMLTEGESVTVNGKTVSINFITSDSKVVFEVNGEITDKLKENEAYELDDGSYIIPTTVLYTDKTGASSRVEFSIGSGKLTLEDGREIQVNDEDVDGLYVNFYDGSNAISTDGAFDKLKITWKADSDELFLTEKDSISMPEFGKIQLAYGGLNYPSSSEKISLKNGETLTLDMGNYDLPVMWWDKTNTQTKLGEENHLLKLSVGSKTSDYVGNGANSTVLTGGVELEEDQRVIVTLMDNDLGNIQTGYYELTRVDNDSSGKLDINLRDINSGKDIKFDQKETNSDKDIDVTLLGADATSAYFVFNTTVNGRTVVYNKVVSDKGLVVTLPTSVGGINKTDSGVITFTEANQDDDINSGVSFNATIKVSSEDKLHVSGMSSNVLEEEVSTDKYTAMVPSDLATKISRDTSGDSYDFDIEYFGKEVTADVQVIAGGSVTTSTTGGLGEIIVKDSEVSSVASKNLIIVGGSCINSAAATALGVPENTCGEAFTQATGVSAGQFLIKGVQDKFSVGKLALVVAGYEAADTVNAVTYITKKGLDDTSAEYTGTSVNDVTLVSA